MPSKLILVRHGHTEWNEKKIIQGWLDTPLSFLGIRQAQATARFLATNFQIDVIYSSDLQRAHTTAQIINHFFHIPLITTTHLRETNLGIFQGQSWQDPNNHKLRQLWQEFTSHVHQRHLHWKDHQGESLHEMYQRLETLLNQLHQQHADQRVLLVTHGGTLNRLLELFQLKHPKDYHSFANTGVTVLEKSSPQYKITLFNHHSHLENLIHQSS